MKRKLSILLIVCLLLQVLGVTAYADETVALEEAPASEVETLSETVEPAQMEEDTKEPEDVALQVQEEAADETEEIKESEPEANSVVEEKTELAEQVSTEQAEAEATSEEKEVEAMSEVLETQEDNIQPESVVAEEEINNEISESLDDGSNKPEKEFEVGLVLLKAGKLIFTANNCNRDDAKELEEDAVILALEKEGDCLKVAFAIENEVKTGYIKADDATEVENPSKYMQAGNVSSVEYCGYYLPIIVVKRAEAKEEIQEAAEEAVEAEQSPNPEEVSEQAALKEEAEIPSEDVQAEEKLEAEIVIAEEVALEEETEIPSEDVQVEDNLEVEIEIATEVTEAVVEAEEIAEEVIEAETEVMLAEEGAEEKETVETIEIANSVAPMDGKITITAAGIITECNTDEKDIYIKNEYPDANGNPVTVTGISETAFARNTTITNVVLDNALSLTYLAKGCFQGCTALKSISFNNVITKIDDDMFKGCTSLNSITFPVLLTEIGANAFEDCSSLTGLSLPSSVTKIGNAAFQNCTSLDTLYMQNGLTEIGSNAFKGCSQLKAIYIPDTVNTVGNSAFENCSSAKILSLSSSMSAINNFCFSGCTSLEKVIIPNSVTQIGREAFQNCNSVKRVEIPATVGTIGSNAFNGINGDAIVLVNTTDATIGTDAFGNNCTIFAYIGSTTEAYAKTHSGITFYPLNIVDFVRQSYNGILGRGADENALYDFSMKLGKGQMTAGEFISVLLTSTEYANRGFLYNFNSAVNAAYSGMLGRGPGASEQADGVKMMSNGVSVCYIANIIAHSAEFITNCNNMRIQSGIVPITENRDRRYDTSAFVSRCYIDLLNPPGGGPRTFDAEGMNYWTGRLLDGTLTGADMVVGFVRSQEFINLGLTDTEAVTNLYKTMLDRTPDAAGMITWTDLMSDGCSIECVVAGFADTPEFRYKCGVYGITPGKVALQQARDINREVTKFVKSCYTAALGRTTTPPYDVNGMNNWTRAIIAKALNPAQVAYGFVFSDECLMRNLSNVQFVIMLYQLYLGRSVDAGWVNWYNALAGGMSRQDLVRIFEQTEEFQNRVAFFYSL